MRDTNRTDSSALYWPFWKIALLLLGVCSPTLVRAQAAQLGVPAFTTAQPFGGVGFVNVANGNAHIEIPIGDSYPQRGGSPYTAKLIYDSRIWQALGESWDTDFGPIQGGWSFMTSKDVGQASPILSTTVCSGGETDSYVEIDWFAPDNTDHQFIVSLSVDHGCGNPNVLSSDAFALDGSGLHLYATITPGTSFLTDQLNMKIVARDGTTLTPINGNEFIPSQTGVYEDPNGNTLSGNSLAGQTPQDTLGRQPITMSFSPNPELPPPFNTPTAFGILNSTGSYTNIQATWSYIHVNTNFQVSGFTEADFYMIVLQSLTLPDGTSYTFGYDCDQTTGNQACSSPGGQAGYYGTLTYIGLPAGDSVSLGYSNFADANGNTNRWVTSSSSTATGTTTYTPATGCGTGCQTVTVTKPSQDQSVYTFTLATLSPGEGSAAWNSSVKFYTGAASGNPLVTIANTFQSFSIPSLLGSQGYTLPATSTITLPGPSGNLVKQTSYTYDSYTYTSGGSSYTGSKAKLLNQTESAYGSGTPGSVVRTTAISYLDDANSTYASANIIDRPTDIQIQGGSGTLAETKVTYDSPGPTSVTGVLNHDDHNYGAGNSVRGNPTLIQQMVGTNNFLSTATIQYDSTGQIVTVTDSAGNVARLGYTDNFFSDSAPAQNPPTGYSTQAPTNAFPTSVMLPLGEKLSLGYYYGTGKQASLIDPNGADYYSHYLDPFDRLTHAFLPATNGGREWVFSVYNSYRHEGSNQIDTYTGIGDTVPSQTCVSCRHDRQDFDLFGRIASSHLDSDPDGRTEVDVTYDSSSRPSTISNPYRSTSDPTYGVETASYDGLNRVTQIKHADNNVVQEFYGSAITAAGGATSELCSGAPLAYPVLVVDETSRKNQRWMDALGRTIETDQPDSSGNLTVASCYSYDALDNLLTVQQGSQTRTYSYDGLSRLTQETPVESGPISVAYTTFGGPCSGDPNAPCQITDGRAITTTFLYDSLDRLTSKSYSNNDPTVTYYYDQSSFDCLAITNGIGHLTGMADGSGSTAWSYDAVGNVLAEQRTIGTVSETTSYTYNLDRSVASVTYPSDRTVAYSYSGAERPLSAIDPVNGINYATGATYSPFGALSSLTLGKSGSFQGILRSYSYNNRLQLTSLTASSSAGSVLNLAFSYSQPTGNNGSIASITNGLDSTRTQNFTYDPLDRIASAKTQSTTGSNCWGLNFGPDSVGNLLSAAVSQCSAPMLSLSTDGRNHVTNQGYTFDGAGNMTGDGTYNYAYDADGRLKSSSAGVSYTYAGDDLRVMKSSGTLYWRSLGGDTLAESNSGGTMSNEYVFFAGDRIARQQINTPPTPNSFFYYFSDQLGSTRVITNSSGSPCYEADYYPYGGEITPSGFTNTCPQNYKFTGYERDPETGLDYAMARYYDSGLGRFTNMDPLDGTPEDTQSWNAYTYTSNNPVNAIDPFGMDDVDLNVFLVYFSPIFSAYSGDWGAPIGWGGPFDAVAGNSTGIMSSVQLQATLFWTPNGYSPCALGCVVQPSMARAFSPPSGAAPSLWLYNGVNSIGRGVGQAWMKVVVAPLDRLSDWEFDHPEVNLIPAAAMLVENGNSGQAEEGVNALADDLARLQEKLDVAVARFEREGFTEAQAASLGENPRMEAAFRGERIDTFFKEAVRNDPGLQHLEVTPRFRFGPDVFNPAQNVWYDVTTEAQWESHLLKYQKAFGQGVPLFYSKP